MQLFKKRIASGSVLGILENESEKCSESKDDLLMKELRDSTEKDLPALEQKIWSCLCEGLMLNEDQKKRVKSLSVEHDLSKLYQRDIKVGLVYLDEEDNIRTIDIAVVRFNLKFENNEDVDVGVLYINPWFRRMKLGSVLLMYVPWACKGTQITHVTLISSGATFPNMKKEIDNAEFLLRNIMSEREIAEYKEDLGYLDFLSGEGRDQFYDNNKYFCCIAKHYYSCQVDALQFNSFSQYDPK